MYNLHITVNPTYIDSRFNKKRQNSSKQRQWRGFNSAKDEQCIKRLFSDSHGRLCFHKFRQILANRAYAIKRGGSIYFTRGSEGSRRLNCRDYMLQVTIQALTQA